MRTKRVVTLWAAAAGAVLLTTAAFARVGQAAVTAAAGGDVPLVVAHRAGAALGPENTLAALERSITAGADMAEVDVRLTRDGVPVLLHDNDLTRTTGRQGIVGEITLDELSGLDVGTHFSTDFAGEKIPTLRETLRAAKGRIRLMLELKPGDREELLALNVADAVLKAGMEDECVIASSSLLLLKQSKALLPEVQTVYITSLLYPGLGAGSVDGYSVDYRWINSATAIQAHGEGRTLYAWTANRREELLELLALGVDGIITDDPAQAEELLAEGETGRPF